jgi:amidase
MRPSQGRIPSWPKPELFVSQLSSDGPMARNARDLARLLSIQAGRDARAPLSIAEGAQDFVPPANASAKGQRIGWLGDLGGHLPMEPGILEVCEAALARLAGAGAIVEPTGLGFDADTLWQAWLLWRRALVAPAVAQALKLPDAREQIKPEALWEHDQAAGLSFNEFMAAAQVRSNFYSHLLGLFERFDALALPVAQVWPFDIALPWPKAVAGRTMDTYHRWMEVTTYATFAGLPAISVPAGFHANGRWPMGLQLIGRPQGDAALLGLAQAWQNCHETLIARRP